MKNSNRLFRVLMAMAAVLGVLSCSAVDDDSVTVKVEAFAFQDKAGGKWGIVSPKTGVVVSPRFGNHPTVVREERYFVRDSASHWHMYAYGPKAQTVGGVYAFASSFHGGRALVAEVGKPVSVIDHDGNTVRLLDKIEGKKVVSVIPLGDGRAIFTTTDSCFGAVDRDGRCTVKPVYCYLEDYGEGMLWGVEKKYSKFKDFGQGDKYPNVVLDSRGNTVFSVRADKFSFASSPCSGGMKIVSVTADNSLVSGGIIDGKGNYVVPPKADNESITSIQGSRFTFFNGAGVGARDMDGETVIAPAYEQLNYDADDILIGTTYTGDGLQTEFLGEDGGNIFGTTYADASGFMPFGGDYSIVQFPDKTLSVIGRDGSQFMDLPRMVNVTTSDGDDCIFPDIADTGAAVDSLRITPDGAMGLSFATSPKEAVALQVARGQGEGNATTPAGAPSMYLYSVPMFTLFGNVEMLFTAVYPSDMATSASRLRALPADDYYDSNDHMAYRWNNSLRPEYFTFTFQRYPNIRGHMHDIYQRLAGKFKAMGTVVRENRNGVVVRMRNGRSAVVCMSDEDVTAYYGSPSVEKIVDIADFKDVREEIRPSATDETNLFVTLPDTAVEEADRYYAPIKDPWGN